MTDKKTMGRSGGNRSTHSHTKQKAESFRTFYADKKHPGCCALDDLKDEAERQKAVQWRNSARAGDLIRRFGEGPLKNLQRINLLRKALAALA